jgi:hypothetical protein
VGVVAAGRKPQGPTPDDIFALTGLTRDDLSALAEGLDEQNLECDYFPTFLDGLKMTHEELIEYLKGHHAHYLLPSELVRKLRELIAKLQRPLTREEIRRQRWFQVRKSLDSRRATYNEAYEVAHLVLEGTPAAASPHMMRQDYEGYEESLPEAERRPQGKRGRPWHRATTRIGKVQ